MFDEKAAGPETFFSFRELEKIPGLVHAVTARSDDGKTATHEDAPFPRQVANSKAAILKHLGVDPAELRFLEQIHSSRIVESDRIDACSATEGDGILILEAGHFGVIRTADCIPLILVAPERQNCCLLHAGWRGTRDHIAGKGVQALCGSAGISPEALVAAIGPCIRVCCYEVGPEFPADFSETGHPVERIFKERHLDLVAANRADLEAAGVKQILDSGICTSCEADRFYSHRARKDTGRLWTVAGFREVAS